MAPGEIPFPPGSLREARIVEIDFAPKILQILDRMAALASGDVEDKKQDAAACNVAEKIVAEADVAMCALDQSGNVGDRSAAISVKLDHADDRVQRRKRIGRDFRMRRRNFPEQRRFARIRITNQRGVRHRAQFEKKMTLLAFLAFGVLDRGAVP